MTDEAPKPEVAEQYRKVAIIGAAPGWEDAPFKDPTWEIWGLSRMYHHIPEDAWDVWFELHRFEELCSTWDGGDTAETEVNRRAYQAWLRTDHGRPKVLQEARPDVPRSIAYPLEMVKQAFPSFYFTNTVSYMVAFALLQGVQELGIWGVDMAAKSEYRYQRPNVEYWIGLAQGAGVKVTIPETSDLLTHRQAYAFEEESQLWVKIDRRANEIHKDLKQMRREKHILELNEAHAEGAVGMLDMLRNNFV